MQTVGHSGAPMLLKSSFDSQNIQAKIKFSNNLTKKFEEFFVCFTFYRILMKFFFFSTFPASPLSVRTFRAHYYNHQSYTTPETDEYYPRKWRHTMETFFSFYFFSKINFPFSNWTRKFSTKKFFLRFFPANFPDQDDFHIVRERALTRYGTQKKLKIWISHWALG